MESKNIDAKANQEIIVKEDGQPTDQSKTKTDADGISVNQKVVEPASDEQPDVKDIASMVNKKSLFTSIKNNIHNASKDVILLLLGGLVGTVFPIILSPTTPATILPLLLLTILVWAFVIVPLLKRALSKRMFMSLSALLLIFMLAAVVGVYVQTTPYFFGTQRLRGLVVGIPVPSSDFSWSTNGSVIASPIREPGDVAVMKLEMGLRGDKPCADAGWGIELLRWDWLRFTRSYDSSLSSKGGVSFYIRGERGGESTGISMKSDRDVPSPSGAASDEEKIPLSSLGLTITQDWQHVSVPFAKLYNFDSRRARNMAFYIDPSLMKSVEDSQTIYIKAITFWDKATG